MYNSLRVNTNTPIPLLYIPQVHPESGRFHALTSYQSSPSASVLLPSGRHSIEVFIRDNKLASTAVSLPAVEIPGPDPGDTDEVLSALLTRAGEAVEQRNEDSFSQLTAVVLGVIRDILSSSSLSLDHSSDVVTHEPAEVRGFLLNLTRDLATEATSKTTWKVVLSLVSAICSDSSQLDSDLRLGSLNVVEQAVYGLTETGGDMYSEPWDADLAVYTLSQVSCIYLT